MAISEKRKEQLEDLQKQLLSLNDLIQKVIDGKSSMKQFADSVGLTQQRLNQEIDNGLYPLLKKVKIANSYEIEQILFDSRSPIERLVHCILGVSDYEMIILDIDEEDIIISILDKALDEKERVVIFSRFGLVDGQPKHLKEVANTFGATSGKIRQIESKALRKLRKPIWLRQLIPNYHLRIQELNEHYIIKALDEQLTHQENAVKDNSDIKLEIDLSELNLNTRAYNALKRIGIKTIGDLTRFTVYDLMHVRNLGRRSLEEIVAKLEKLDITLDGGGIDDNSEYYTDINKLHANTFPLKRIGVYSIDHLSKIPTSELLNHMTEANVKEIMYACKSQFGVELINDAGIK